LAFIHLREDYLEESRERFFGDLHNVMIIRA